jgi:putative ABC transport system substrate-binding protein
MATSADPVALGLVTSLAVPGGNITGSTYFPAELTAKRIELLKDALPRIASVAVLADQTITATRQMYMQAMEATAKVAKIALHEFPVRGPDEFGSTFEAMKKRHFGAVAVPENPMFIANAKALADLALKQHLPLIGGGEFADAGALLGYGANLVELYRRVGYFVDKIFKGAKPGSIPVEQPTKFELVVNMRTARALGIKIPNSIHVRADKVID